MLAIRSRRAFARRTAGPMMPATTLNSTTEAIKSARRTDMRLPSGDGRLPAAYAVAARISSRFHDAARPGLSHKNPNLPTSQPLLQEGNFLSPLFAQRPARDGRLTHGRYQPR